MVNRAANNQVRGISRESRTRETVFLALLGTFAIVLHTVEAAIPSPLPWIKIGLANVITLVTIPLFGGGAALAVTIVRVVVGSMITGTFLGPSFIISLFAGIAATLAMIVTFRYFSRKLSLVGVSVIGAYIHSFVQVAVVYLLLIRHKEIFYILPFFLSLSLLMGLATGLAAILLEKKLADVVQVHASLGVRGR
ncbi:MAG: Gx transporter family protein [Nitrospirota bacterium]|nr:Gx transporter family protein [Nitrospirota bacterium]